MCCSKVQYGTVQYSTAQHVTVRILGLYCLLEFSPATSTIIILILILNSFKTVAFQTLPLLYSEYFDSCTCQHSFLFLTPPFLFFSFPSSLPFSSCSFLLFCFVLFSLVNELVKHRVADFRNKSVSNLSMPERLFAGACAGLSYWVGTFPLDAIKVLIIYQNYSSLSYFFYFLLKYL